ncbi:uncharacterized protein IUM83_00188 [Phytophthora cinnamomi]|uniref:uncharacterized protein n=1 Tax=Phytophthora cinnamomi TaxID=4785 RepID=UPI0035593E99|nr:hypothetical protein IUM83_00188 [Phytophthora cinnamomi]
MAPRVKAVVRLPRHGWATDREVVVDSDEEWVEVSAESSGTGSSTSKQRRSDDFDRLQTMQSDKRPVVMAPSPEMTEFVSWGALDEYLKGYSAETYQSFRVRTNNKVEARNKKIQDSGSTKLLVPEEWVHYSKTFVCTHAGRVSAVSAWSGGIEFGISRAELGIVGDQLGTRQTELGTVGGTRDECKHPFEAYFVKNWDNCRHMWCAFERQNACTQGNNTNNRLESSWKQLKELVDSFMQVDECIVSIMVYQAQAERKFLDAVYKLPLLAHVHE